jgi:hypothetical protein
MPDELTTDTLLRIKLPVAIAILVGLVTGGAGAVGYVYRTQDNIATIEAQRRNEILQNYPTRQELWDALGRVTQKQDEHYNTLKDRVGTIEDKVDGILVYLRKRL